MISQECTDWLRRQFEKSRGYQTARGIDFRLTFDEYVNLWGPKRLRRIDGLLQEGALDAFQRHRKWAWVLTWRRKEDKAYGEMNAATAAIKTREGSEKTFYLQKGEKHSTKAKKAIGEKHRGKVISQAHREAIGASKRGKSQTPAQIAKRVEATKATRKRKAAAAAAASGKELLNEQRPTSIIEGIQRQPGSSQEAPVPPSHYPASCLTPSARPDAVSELHR